MLPQFLKGLLTSPGKIPYTRDWPEALHAPTPLLDLSTGSLGFTRFGGSIDESKVLGRPDEYLRYEGIRCGLAYHSKGFLLEFDPNRRLAFACFYISPEQNEQNRKLRYRPVFFKKGMTLEPHTPDSVIRSLFGKTIEEYSDAEESVLSFTVSGLEVDTVRSREGKLIELTVASRNRV